MTAGADESRTSHADVNAGADANASASGRSSADQPPAYAILAGIAVIILVSQLPRLLGFPVEGDGPIARIPAIVAGVAAGRTDPASLVVGLAVLVTILVLQTCAAYISRLIPIFAPALLRDFGFEVMGGRRRAHGAGADFANFVLEQRETVDDLLERFMNGGQGRMRATVGGVLQAHAGQEVLRFVQHHSKYYQYSRTKRVLCLL